VTKSIDQTEDTDDAKTEQAFANYDLKAEAPEARKPTVRFAFEFQTLLEMFIPADEEALESRRISRMAGITAVALVLSAMLLASFGPILSSAGHAAPTASHAVGAGGHGAAVSQAPADGHAAPSADTHAPTGAEASHDDGFNTHAILGTVAALLGLSGTVLGITGMRRSASRRKWLRARLTTETLRLFHFHYIAARLPEIVAVAGDAARREQYLAERAARWNG
jgi:hypothetical protein